jgi:hypothetical protein
MALLVLTGLGHVIAAAYIPEVLMASNNAAAVVIS